MQHYRSTLTRLVLIAAILGISHAAAAQHKTWYLAEGATNAFFQEELLIANPTSTDAHVAIAFLLSDGAEQSLSVTVPKTSRFTLRVNTVPGLENVNASAVVTSDVDVLVERSMYWPGPQRLGGHNSVGVPGPAPKWYLAEGALGFFETYILIANPGNADSNVKVTYLVTGGGTIVTNYTVKARSRQTIRVADAAPAAGAFSTIVETTNGQNIVVERAMYWNGFQAGHNAVGITAPALIWGFAEGFTGSGFSTFLLLGNPSTQAANVRVTFLFDDGSAPFQQNYTLASNSRTTIEASQFPQLRDRAFSIGVEGTNNVPIIAERAMYLPGFREGHATGGLTVESAKWGFAEGLEDSFNSIPYETFYLLANIHDTAAQVNATFYREDGTGIVKQLTIAPRSRFTLSGKSYGELSNQRFAAFFESTNGVQIAAERAVYWGAGRFGADGSAGTPWTGEIAAPPAPPAPTTLGVAPNAGGISGGQAVTITGTNYYRGAQVLFGGTPAASVIVTDASRIIAITPPRGTGKVDVSVVSNGVTTVLTGGYTFEGAPPPPVNRTPDPPPGQLLPLPNLQGIVFEVAAQFPGALRNSCQEAGGSWEFMDRVVDRLREIDTRWGYNCKRGNCPDLSHDVVAYHAGAGPEVNGALETFTVDIISGHCGPNPVAAWQPHQYIPGPGAARWHNRFRF